MTQASQRAAARHLYVHVPFCARRCVYCDFAIAVRRDTPVDEYVDGIRGELALAPEPHPGALGTVYLGGGTPSRLGGEGVARVLEVIRDNAAVEPDAEVALEANPDDVTPERARAWARAGVNRVSLGVQSFDPAVLTWMHRVHSAEQAARAPAILRNAGIANISLDLIFALPSALARDWPRDLDQALALEPDHVSLYGLTIEPHTPLGRWHVRGAVAEAEDDRYAEEYLLAHERMTSAGLEHYEVSNFARPGCRSRHNSAYWAGVPYLGVGPGAHSFDGAIRRWNVGAYARWVARLAGGTLPEEGRERLDSENRAAEQVYLGLRTSAGLLATDAERALARPWVSAGWLRDEAGTLVPTVDGWLRLDAMAASLTHRGSR